MAILTRTTPIDWPGDVEQSPLARRAGPLALTAGVLFIIQQLVMYSVFDRSRLEATMAHPLFLPSAIGYLVAFGALLVALVAVYEWEADRAGVLGAIGFGAALVGTMLLAGNAW